MAIESSNVYQLWPGSLANGRGAGWKIETDDSTATAEGAGWLAGFMRGGRSNNLGMSTGDVCFVHFTTGSFAVGLITASTIDQATTNASTAWNYAFDGTITFAP